MANNRVIVEIGGNAGSFLNTLRRVSQATTDMETRTKAALKPYEGLATGARYAAKGLGVLTVGMAAATAATAILAAGILHVSSVAAKFETMQAAFKTLTGSKSIAKSLMDDVIALSAASGKSGEVIASATQKLLAFGVSAAQVKTDMRTLAEISAATGAELEGLALVFGQVKVKGKLMAEESLQFAERNIAIIPLIAQSLKKSTAEVLVMQEKGRISHDMVRAALEEMVSKGGQAYGALAEYAKTTAGAQSAMNAEFTNSARLLGEEVNPTLIKVMKWLTEVAKEANKAGGAIDQLGTNMDLIIEAGSHMKWPDFGNQFQAGAMFLTNVIASVDTIADKEKEAAEAAAKLAAETAKILAIKKEEERVALELSNLGQSMAAQAQTEIETQKKITDQKEKQSVAAKKARDEERGWNDELQAAVRENNELHERIDARLEDENKAREEALRLTEHELQLLGAQEALADALATGSRQEIESARMMVSELEKQEAIRQKTAELIAQHVEPTEAALKAEQLITAELRAQNAEREARPGTGGELIGPGREQRRIEELLAKQEELANRGREGSAEAERNEERIAKSRKSIEDSQARNRENANRFQKEQQEREDRIAVSRAKERREKGRETEEDRKKRATDEANAITGKGEVKDQVEGASTAAVTEQQKTSNAIAEIKNLLAKHLEVTTTWTENVTSS